MGFFTFYVKASSAGGETDQTETRDRLGRGGGVGTFGMTETKEPGSRSPMAVNSLVPPAGVVGMGFNQVIKNGDGRLHAYTKGERRWNVWMDGWDGYQMADGVGGEQTAWYYN